MSILDALILGLVQGLTEFLPVSSSGHLVLGQHFLGIQNPGMLAFDVYVHLGTLISVCIIFRKDIGEIVDIPLGTVKSRLHAAVVAFGEAYREAAVESAKRRG